MHREMAEDSSSEPSDSAQAYTSAVIIANPTSGSHARQAHQMQETITFLRNAGWKVELQVTVAPGDGSLSSCWGVVETWIRKFSCVYDHQWAFSQKTCSSGRHRQYTTLWWS